MEKMEMKLWHMFNKEMQGADHYLKLAKEYEKHKLEFLEQAETEYQQAEAMMDIYEQCYTDNHHDSDIYDDTIYQGMHNKAAIMENKIARFSAK